MWIGKICLQGYFKLVFESILHSGARGCSEVYARRTLALWACKALFSRVRIPPCAKSVSPVVWICPSGRKKTVHGRPLSCARTFYSKICYHSAKRETPWRIFRSNAKACLAWKRIPCYPNRCQKSAFRTVPEILKLSAAAFAWMIAKQTRLWLEWLKCFSSLSQKRIDFSQSLQKHFQ